MAAEGRNNTYPNSWWMPGLGTQLGNVLTTSYSCYPSIGKFIAIININFFSKWYSFELNIKTESAYRIEEEAQPALPKILVQPIGYDEAEILLRHLSSKNAAPHQWVGTLDVKYNLGPLLPGWKVRLNVSTSNQLRTVYNTIGILRGSVEPGINIHYVTI